MCTCVVACIYVCACVGVCMCVGACMHVYMSMCTHFTCIQVSMYTSPTCSSTISSGHSEPPVPTTVSESLSVPTPAMSTSGRRCEAIYPFPGEASGDLAFKEGDVILVTKREGEWWTGVLDGKEGVFPYNYVREMEGDIDHDGGVPGPAETRNTSVQSAPNRSYSTASKDSAADTPSRQTQDPGPSVSVITQPLIARVKVAFQAEQDTQLSLNQGELIKVTKQADNGWWVGELQSRGKQRRSGWFPANRVELLASKSTSNQTVSLSERNILSRVGGGGLRGSFFLFVGHFSHL